MQISKKVITKEFSDEKSKQAYLKACKWLAKHIYSKDEFAENFTVKVVKADSEFPTFEVSVYLTKNERDLRLEHCKKCKNIHSFFYSPEGVRCDRCEYLAFKKNVESEIKNKIDFYKEILEKDEE